MHKKVHAKQRQMVADGEGWKKVAGKPGNLYCRTGVKITEHSLSQVLEMQSRGGLERERERKKKERERVCER